MGGNPRRTRVVILGSGCASMGAAFHLTSTQELRDRYEVTVYQQGHRLGGKCASGRNLAYGARIEEHGLHMFLGYYTEAFSLMRAVYDEWVPPPKSPVQSLSEAFIPHYEVTFAERDPRSGDWIPWSIRFPDLGPPPEVSPGERTALEPEDVARAGRQLIAQILRDLISEVASRLVPQILSNIFGSAGGLLEPLEDWLERLGASVGSELGDLLLDLGNLLDHVAPLLGKSMEDNPKVRHALLLLRLGIVIFGGYMRDVYPYGEDGYERINHLDFKDWLEANGAEPDVAFSPPIQAFYDMAFAYEAGIRDRKHAQAAAGAVLKTLLLMMAGYHEAPLWKMNGGMADVVFAPLYEVLKARGVRFEFFHRVKQLRATRDAVTHVELWQQARTHYQVPYAPLLYVDHMPVWPSEPDWAQLVDGDELRRDKIDFESSSCDRHVGSLSLELGRDFDLVVLGISVAALPSICQELTQQDANFRQMLSATKTVRTAAAQLWFDRDLADLGWAAPPTVLTGYTGPQESSADMSYLIAREDWPSGTEPRACEYLCGVFTEGHPPIGPDPSYPEREKERAFRDLASWLQYSSGLPWPNALPSPGRFRYEWLHAAPEKTGEERLRAQYYRANIDPTERYVLTVPGSVAFRLAADGTRFQNLFLAGDWTKTSLNAGCAEAAFESGRLAKEAMERRRASGAH